MSMLFRHYTIITAFLLMLGGSAVFSQSTWNKRFGDINYEENSVWNSEVGRYISYNENGIVLIYGWVNSGNNYWQTRFMEIGFDGEVHFTKSYGTQNEKWSLGFNNSGDKTSDGGFVNGGGVNPFNENGGIFPRMIRFDSIGDTLWMKKYFDASKFWVGEKVIQTSDEGFALVGRTEVSAENNNPQIFVLKTDANGEIEWYQEYGDPECCGEYGSSIAQVNDGGYLIGGAYLSSPSAFIDSYLLRINSDGDFLWDQIIGNSLVDDGNFYVRNVIDGNLVLGRGKGIEMDGSVSISQSELRKITPDGEMIWNRNFGPISDDSFALVIKEIEDGNLLVQGLTNKEDPTNELYGRVGYLAKYTTEGDSLWMRIYSYQPEGTPNAYTVHELADATPLPDGGYAAVGWTLVIDTEDNPGEYFGQDLWVFKTDSVGCLVTGCDTVTSIFELDNPLDQTWFTFGPNPVHSTLNVYLTSIASGLLSNLTLQLISLEGKILREITARSIGGLTYLIEVDKLPAGMYLLTLKNQTSVLQSERIFIQH